MRILLVEDDTLLAQILADHLTDQHYAVDIATDGEIGFDYVQSATYDLIVLDVNLPKLDGISLCQMVRKYHCTMPILLLTAQGNSSDKVTGLDAGADDYVVKPCTVDEISARIRALLRRFTMEGNPDLTWNNLCLNPVTREVMCNNQPLSLSAKEYSLLELLLRHPQRIFSSGSILEHLWSFEDAPGEETVRSHVKRLRRKLKAAGCDDIIDTVYGMGYRLKQLTSVPAAPTTPAPVAPENQARAAAMAIWQQFKQPTLERVEQLDRAVAALEAGRLPDDVRQEAAHAAHKLAGSLAMFGFPAGTQLGRNLEEILRSTQPLTIAAIKPLVDELHDVLVSPLTLQDEEESTPELPAYQTRGTHEKPSLRLHVLLVDEDVTLGQQMQSLAAELDLHISMVPNPGKAKAFLAGHAVDGVLLDLRFAESTEAGLAFLEELSQQSPVCPVIVLTHQVSFADRLASIRRGCDRFISKSTPLHEVVALVKHEVQQRAIAPLRVLAVDDDPLILYQLNQYLPTWNIQLTSLSSAELLWQSLETVQPNLVILDVQMPLVSGLELCRVIRSDAIWGHLPILFLTAQRDPEAILSIYKAGADDYVSKPFTGIEIATRIFNRLARTPRVRPWQPDVVQPNSIP